MKLIVRWISLIYVVLLVTTTTAQVFPDGLIAYTAHEDCEIYCINRILIVDPNTGDTNEIVAPGHSFIYGETLDWSAGQRYLMYWTGDFKAHIADAQTGENIGEIEFYQDIGREIRQGVWYDWHPTLPLIAFIYINDFEEETPHYSLHLFDVTTQEWTLLVDDLDILPYFLQWSPDGKKILFKASDAESYPESNIYLYDMMTQDYVNLTTEDWYRHPDWARDSQRITYALATEVYIMNTATGQSESIYDFEDLRIGGSEWALDDTALLVWTHDTADDANDLEMYLVNLTDESAELILEVPPYFSGYDISTDGSAVVYLASEDHPKDVCIFDLVTREESCLDGEKAYMVSYPAWGN